MSCEAGGVWIVLTIIRVALAMELKPFVLLNILHSTGKFKRLFPNRVDMNDA
jgi:hypothetical protein